MKIVIHAKRDAESGGFYVVSAHVEGLNTSGATLDELRERVALLVSDLVEHDDLEIVVVDDDEQKAA